MTGYVENWSCFWLVVPISLVSRLIVFQCTVATGMLTGAFGSESLVQNGPHSLTEQGHGLRNREGITPANVHAWETASSYAVGALFSMARRLK